MGMRFVFWDEGLEWMNKKKWMRNGLSLGVGLEQLDEGKENEWRTEKLSNGEGGGEVVHMVELVKMAEVMRMLEVMKMEEVEK